MLVLVQTLGLNMSTTRFNHRSKEWRPRGAVLAIIAGVFASASAMPQARAAPQCEAFKWQEERLDYTAAKDQVRVTQVEQHHFDADTENLTRGITGSLGGDLDFLVRYSPNHHRGLTSMVRLALRDKTPQPPGIKATVECYLLRGLEFKPDDVEVMKIYATYLSRSGRSDEALAWFERAEKLAPDDAVLAYNMGLLMTEKRDFERARTYAKKAYAGGIDLPGLRDKLAKQGQWR